MGHTWNNCTAPCGCKRSNTSGRTRYSVSSLGITRAHSTPNSHAPPPCAAPSTPAAALPLLTPAGCALRLPPMSTPVSVEKEPADVKSLHLPYRTHELTSAHEQAAEHVSTGYVADRGQSLTCRGGCRCAALSACASPQQAPACRPCLRCGRVARNTQCPSSPEPSRASQPPLLSPTFKMGHRNCASFHP